MNKLIIPGALALLLAGAAAAENNDELSIVCLDGMHDVLQLTRRRR